MIVTLLLSFLPHFVQVMIYLHEVSLNLVVLAFVYTRPALTVSLNYGGQFNRVRSAWNIQFTLAGDLRLGWHELNSGRFHVNNQQEKHYMRRESRLPSCKHPSDQLYLINWVGGHERCIYTHYFAMTDKL